MDPWRGLDRLQLRVYRLPDGSRSITNCYRGSKGVAGCLGDGNCKTSWVSVLLTRCSADEQIKWSFVQYAIYNRRCCLDVCIYPTTCSDKKNRGVPTWNGDHLKGGLSFFIFWSIYFCDDYQIRAFSKQCGVLQIYSLFLPPIPFWCRIASGFCLKVPVVSAFRLLNGHVLPRIWSKELDKLIGRQFIYVLSLMYQHSLISSSSSSSLLLCEAFWKGLALCDKLLHVGKKKIFSWHS